MTVTVIAITGFGVFTALGGIIGYLKARSTASLIAGLVSGGVLLGCARALLHGHRAAAILAAAVATLLGGRFYGTWRTKRRIMPDFLMVLLSLVTVFIITLTWTRR